VTGTRVKGGCPECGRVIAGKPAGPGWVALGPHKRTTTTRHDQPCLSRGGYRRVPQITAGPR
jgi:hypothetical protein